MRLSLGTLPALTLALALTNGAIALAQDSGAADPNATTSKTPQVTQPSEGGVNWKGVGVGAGTMAGNVLYVPAKLAYGLLGGIGGGAAWALTGGNKQVADTVWRSSLGGDYIITPDMIQGKERVHFSGPTDTAPDPDSSSSAATSTSSTSLASAGPGSSSSYRGMSSNSSLSSTSLSSTSMPSSDATALGGTHPIDSGAGPVRASAATSSYKAPSTGSASRYGSSAAGSSAPAPKLSTSIE